MKETVNGFELGTMIAVRLEVSENELDRVQDVIALAQRKKEENCWSGYTLYISHLSTLIREFDILYQILDLAVHKAWRLPLAHFLLGQKA